MMECTIVDGFPSLTPSLPHSPSLMFPTSPLRLPTNLSLLAYLHLDLILECMFFFFTFFFNLTFDGKAFGNTDKLRPGRWSVLCFAGLYASVFHDQMHMTRTSPCTGEQQHCVNCTLIPGGLVLTHKEYDVANKWLVPGRCLIGSQKLQLKYTETVLILTPMRTRGCIPWTPPPQVAKLKLFA